MPRFAFSDISQASVLIDAVFLNSPQYECDPLSDALGARTLLKVETHNPIRSFKGRGSDYLVRNAAENQLICASAGNFGQAMAYSCRKKNIALTVYASVHANPFKVERMKALGAEVIQQGSDFDSAKETARSVACSKNIRFVEDSVDVDTLIGAGTLGMELSFYEKMTADAVLVPLGNGALICGVAMGIRKLWPDTKVIGIQSSGAPAMVESWKTNTVVVHDKVSTIADGIGVRVPVEQALWDMKGQVDDALLVSDETIVKAMKLIHLHTGLAVEPSAATGVAAMMENPELFSGKKVATILTGGNLTEEQMQRWF